jgi:hypothetical protein
MLCASTLLVSYPVGAEAAACAGGGGGEEESASSGPRLKNEFWQFRLGYLGSDWESRVEYR